MRRERGYMNTNRKIPANYNDLLGYTKELIQSFNENYEIIEFYHLCAPYLTDTNSTIIAVIKTNDIYANFDTNIPRSFISAWDLSDQCKILARTKEELKKLYNLYY